MKLEKYCMSCGKVFIAQRSTTKYCSHNCNSKYYKQKKRDEKIRLAQGKSAQKIGDITGYLTTDDKIFIETINEKKYLNIKETYTLLNISRSSLWEEQYFPLSKSTLEKVNFVTLD